MSKAAKDAPLGMRIWQFLGSLQFATLLFILLGCLTFAGTWEQQNMSLYDVQVKYFESYVLVWWVGDVLPIPMFGGMVLLSALFVNVLIGGVIRLRKNKRTMFILAVHLGILSLLLGTFIEHRLSTKGQMKIFVDTTENEYYDIHQWEVLVSAPAGDGRREYVLPWTSFKDLEAGETVRWAHEDLPFDIVLSDVARNGQPQPAQPGDEHAIEGFFVARLKPAGIGDGVNIPALVATLHPEGGSGAMRSILWGKQVYPWQATVGDDTYYVDLRPRTWEMPFKIRLDRFEKEMYGGSSIPKRYSSYVTKIDGGTQEPVHITMNVPLRWRGYTFYQSDYGPKPGEPAGTPDYSVLSVVNNPSDQWPKYMLYFVIAPAMFLHFLLKLLNWIGAERRRKLRVGTTAVALLACAPLLGGCDYTTGSNSTWSETVQQTTSSVPVQAEGRVKPLYTWVSFGLLGMNHKRSCLDASGEKLKPTEWFLDTAFRPEQARTHRCFSVKTKAVLEAIGAEDATKGHKMADRYTYDEFVTPATKARLGQLATQYRTVVKKERSALQAGILELDNSVALFEGIQAMFAWAREDVPIEDESLRPLFDGREGAPMSDIVERAPVLLGRMRAGMGSDPQGSDASDEAKAIGRFMMAAFTKVEHTLRVGLFPPTKHVKIDETTWLGLRDLVGMALLRGAVDPDHVAILRAMETMARAGDDEATFAEGARRWQEITQGLAQARGEYGEVSREMHFYASAPLDGAMGMYGLGLLFAILMIVLHRVRAFAILTWIATVGGLAYQTYGIVLRCLIRGKPPIGTLYETVLFIGGSGVLALLVTEWLTKRRIALGLAPFMGFALLLLAGKYEVLEGGDTMTPLQAVLDTNFWLATHVVCISLGYMGGLVAALFAHVYLFGKLVGEEQRGPEWFRMVARMTYGMLCFALLTSLVGTILGGVWANDSWGRFWGWDPKENGALLICLAQLAILHARMGGMIKALGISIATVFQGMIIAASWWGTNLLSIGLHSYGFTQGVFNALALFWLFEAAVILVGFYIVLRERAPVALPSDGNSNS